MRRLSGIYWITIAFLICAIIGAIIGAGINGINGGVAGFLIGGLICLFVIHIACTIIESIIISHQYRSSEPPE